jgi:predicted nucleotidyltransferase
LDVLRRNSIRVEAIYLFGSFAAGCQHQWSDIDLAIVSPDFKDNSMEDQEQLMCLTWDVDVRIEPHPFRPEDFTPDDPWVAEIMQTGIKIV